MPCKNIDISEALFEKKAHGDYTFPLSVDSGLLSLYEHGIQKWSLV